MTATLHAPPFKKITAHEARSRGQVVQAARAAKRARHRPFQHTSDGPLSVTAVANGNFRIQDAPLVPDLVWWPDLT